MEPVKIIKNFLIENTPENGVVIKQRKRLYFSAFMMDELDQYIADNYDALKAEGALSFKIPNEVKTANKWATCDTDYVVIASFPAVDMPPRGFLEDFDIGINYKRFFDYKDLTDVNGTPAINCKLSMSFDTLDGDKMQNSIIEHYMAYLVWSVTTIDVDPEVSYPTNYVSNDIYQKVALLLPTLEALKK